MHGRHTALLKVLVGLVVLALAGGGAALAMACVEPPPDGGNAGHEQYDGHEHCQSDDDHDYTAAPADGSASTMVSLFVHYTDPPSSGDECPPPCSDDDDHHWSSYQPTGGGHDDGDDDDCEEDCEDGQWSHYQDGGDDDGSCECPSSDKKLLEEAEELKHEAERSSDKAAWKEAAAERKEREARWAGPSWEWKLRYEARQLWAEARHLNEEATEELAEAHKKEEAAKKDGCRLSSVETGTVAPTVLS